METTNTLAAAQNIEERDYWLKKLSGTPGKASFPYDSNPALPGETLPETLTFVIDGDVFARLMKISRGADVRLYLLLLSGIIVLIRKYTAHRDILTGTAIHKQDFEGELINTILPIRIQLPARMTFKELLLQTRQTLLEASQHQDYPLEQLFNRLNLPATGDEFPLFDIVTLLENIHEESYVKHTQPNILFSFLRKEQDIRGVVKFNSLRYHKDTIARIITHFCHLLREVLFQVDLPLADIAILPETEKKQLLLELNRTQREFPGDKTVVHCFQEQVEIIPHHTAVVFEDNHLTYQCLNEKVNPLAGALWARGVKTGDIVGLLIDRSLEMAVGILAVLKASAAYLPLDPALPGARNDFMIKDCRAKAILTHQEVSDILRDENTTGTGETTNPRVKPKPGELAYIIYTSGTTGKPKGVMVEHRNVINTLNWFGGTYIREKGIHVIQLSNYTFDPSVEQALGTLIHGAVVYLVDGMMATDFPRLRDFIDRKQINLINFTPQWLKELLQERKLGSLQAVISGGEKLDEAVKDQILGMAYVLYNHYGPTETTIDALTGRCTANEVALGKPIANYKAYILSDCHELLPRGVPGQLCIAGRGVTRGYLNQPELTKEKFVQNPFHKKDRMYRTGDLAKWLPNGEIKFLGRGDHQVKIRGFRIELEEIESQLLSLDGITDAAVIVRSNQKQENYLHAYFVSPQEMEIPELRNTLSNYLPFYMIPVRFTRVPAIPRTGSGKIDRKTLSTSPTYRQKSEITHVEPKNDLEKILTRIWQEVLSLEKVGIYDNFFDLGGHSLNIVQLNNRFKETFNHDIPVVSIFDYPTVSLFAQYLEGIQAGTARKKSRQIAGKNQDNIKMKTAVNKMKRTRNN